MASPKQLAARQKFLAMVRSKQAAKGAVKTPVKKAAKKVKRRK